jgi:hypothetical protein
MSKKKKFIHAGADDTFSVLVSKLASDFSDVANSWLKGYVIEEALYRFGCNYNSDLKKPPVEWTDEQSEDNWDKQTRICLLKCMKRADSRLDDAFIESHKDIIDYVCKDADNNSRERLCDALSAMFIQGFISGVRSTGHDFTVATLGNTVDNTKEKNG